MHFETSLFRDLHDPLVHEGKEKKARSLPSQRSQDVHHESSVEYLDYGISYWIDTLLDLLTLDRSSRSLLGTTIDL